MHCGTLLMQEEFFDVPRELENSKLQHMDHLNGVFAQS